MRFKKAFSSTPVMRQDSMLGWLKHLLIGLALIGAGAEVGWAFGASTWWTWIIAGLACASGLAMLVHAEWRERPRRVLRKARRTLVFPNQWSVKFNKRIVRCGVVPVAVTRSDGVRFVIDIQAHKHVTWGTPTDGTGKPPLVDAKGKRLKPDPVGPLLQAAEGASAVPVLWLPEASTVKNLRHPDSHLIVVMGTARDLKHAVHGAEVAPIGPRLPKARRESARADGFFLDLGESSEAAAANESSASLTADGRARAAR